LRPDPQFVDISDPELLHLVCTAEDNGAPYKEFVRRFHPELKQICKRKCDQQKLDPHIGETISHEVFDRVGKYKSFKKEHFRGGDGRKWILAYLSRSATRLFCNHHNQEKRQQELPDTYLDNLRAEAQAIDPAHLQEIKEKTTAVLRQLTKKEMAVVLADIEYKKHTKYLPDEVTSALAEQLGVKSATIRKLRQRAAEKLNKAMNEINEA
jgi:DNA-directed RNA polymerase specialized sigma24 family protein